MGGHTTADYLDGLPPAQATELARLNEPGLTALRAYLASGEAVAFLGAGVSAPLYPLWTGLIDAALRLATRHQLAWHEFDALHARLVPPGLDPHPGATVERLVAAEKAAKASPDEGEH